MVGALASGCTREATATANPSAVVRTAPNGAVAPIGADAWALAGRLSARTYTTDTTAALVAGLARSGIGTYADPSAARAELPVVGSASPIRLLDFQTHALAVGAWGRAAFTGAELDTVVPLPAGATGMPTTSELLAGYVAAADSPGGALARALMAGQNLLAPTALRFPAVVLVLFAADLAGHARRPADLESGAAWRRTAAADSAAAALPATMVVPARQPASGGICSAAASWINNTVVGFFAALRLASPNNVPGAIVVSIWNWLVGTAQALVQKLISTLTDAVLSTIRNVAQVVSVAAENIASLVPYAVKVVASGDGGGGTFRLGPQRLSGSFTATVSAGDLPTWPAVMADCAEVSKIKLPDFKAKGIALTWGPLAAVGDPMLEPTVSGHITDVTDADGRASWDFHTDVDPGDPHGDVRNQVDSMPVSVHRPEIAKAEDSLTYALLGDIPDLLRPYAARLFAPYIDGLQSRLNTLLDARGGGVAILVYHDAAPSTHPVTPGGCTPSDVPPGTYVGTNTNTFSEKMPISGGELVDHNNATGPVTLTIATDGTLTGTWSFHMRDAFDESVKVSGVSATYHSNRTWEMTGGRISGTLCNLSLTSGSVRQLTCVGTCGDGAAEPAPVGVLPPLGAPVAAGRGHLTWQLQRNAADGSYSDTFTIATVGPP